MIVAQLVQATTSRSIPNSAPAILAGQAIARTNLPVSNSNTVSVLGIAQADLPAFVAAPQVNGVTFNSSRTLNVATNGRLAIRCNSLAQFNSIGVGQGFQFINGDAYVLGSTGASQPAVSLNGDSLIVDEKVVGADGVGYLLVFFN
jgi:hypothetical protein